MLKCTLLSSLILGLGLVGPATAANESAPIYGARLPEIAALTVDSDFTVFMQEGVSADVRRAALRRLWVLMQLPLSCEDLCYEAERPGLGLAQVASVPR